MRNAGTSQRVCHVTTVHPRYDARIFLKEARSVAQAGYETHLVVGDGYGDEVRDGVHIHDIGKRPASRRKRMRQQPARAIRAVRALSPAVVHLHDPELLPLGVKLAKAGLRVIYDAHEDVPRQIQNKYWIPRLWRMPVARGFEWFENRAVRRFAGVVGATPQIAARFAGLGVYSVCVNNFPLRDEMVPAAGIDRRKSRSVCYTGVITRLRGIVEIVRALPLVPDVRLILCGKFGDPGLEDEIRLEEGWQQVDYRGEVGRAEVADAMASSFAGLVTYLPAPNHGDAQPNKLFEYMSASLPVIASNFPVWEQMVQAPGAGICVDPTSSQQIANAIWRLRDNPDEVERMAAAGRSAVVGRYNWENEAKNLIAFYEEVT